MNASGTGERGALTLSRLGATDPSNLNGDGGVCVCVCVCVCVRAPVCACACVRVLVMIIIKIVILYFIQIGHTDDFPSTAGYPASRGCRAYL